MPEGQKSPSERLANIERKLIAFGHQTTSNFTVFRMVERVAASITSQPFKQSTPASRGWILPQTSQSTPGRWVEAKAKLQAGYCFHSGAAAPPPTGPGMSFVPLMSLSQRTLSWNRPSLTRGKRPQLGSQQMGGTCVVGKSSRRSHLFDVKDLDPATALLQNVFPLQTGMKERPPEGLKLEGSKCKGQLLIFGATNWDLIGRKEVPKQQAAYRNLGQNLWGPHRYGCLSGVRVRTVVSGSCAAHSLLITTEGKLWSWGRNEKGQLGHGDTKRVEAPRLIEALSQEVIVLAACGRNHTLALTETGSVFAFGENKMGQLGLGNQTDAVPSPAQIMYNGQPITKMACGAEFSMIMDCKGNLYSFGCPEFGQLGHNSDGKFIARAQRIEYDCELVPRRVAIFIEKTKDGQILPVPNVVVRDVACGANHTLVLDSQKRVFSWGFGGYGRLGHAEQKDEMVPRLVKLFDFPGRGACQIYAGYTCSFAVSEVGGLFFWGATNTSRESTMYPKAVQDLCGWRIRSLACGKSSIIVAADESTISWGPSPTFGELGYGDHKPKSSTAAQEVKTLDGIFSEQVAMGYSHSLVIARDESETEKEKLKRLPEYNPRTL
ncbi:PREDICTED: protein RCC2 [Dipodomys ordii]|uniref:Protein RCC2 n=1 Tax=Dipodomys ordii TaxID=10020 RepID=A0A1S3GJH7_DIPOR|nr:PREDICTED: protein RCC2 [Dipodomys ordii]